MHVATPFYGSRRMTAALRLAGHGQPQAGTTADAGDGAARAEPKAEDQPPLDAAPDLPLPAARAGGRSSEPSVGGRHTYILMARGFLYLAVVMDWYSRYVLTWRPSNTIDTAFCLDALEDTLRRGRPEILNTELGAQFTSAAFTTDTAGVRISMDGRVRWSDHVFVERLWRSLKYQEVHLKTYADGLEARIGIGQWLRFYNECRPHQVLGDRTPAAVWAADVSPVNLPLRLDAAGVAPATPQRQQQQNVMHI